MGCSLGISRYYLFLPSQLLVGLDAICCLFLFVFLIQFAIVVSVGIMNRIFLVGTSYILNEARDKASVF